MLRLQSLALALTTAVVVASQAPAAPDLILVNGRVFTADARMPWATSATAASICSTSMASIHGMRSVTTSRAGYRK